MIGFNPYDVRLATEADADALVRLAELDSQRPLAGRALLAEHDGAPVAAIALESRRVIADPFQLTLPAVAALRVRAGALTAADRTPSLRERVLAGIRVRRPAAAA